MGPVQAVSQSWGSPFCFPGTCCARVLAVFLSLSGWERPSSACGCVLGAHLTGWTVMRPQGLGIVWSGVALDPNLPFISLSPILSQALDML